MIKETEYKVKNQLTFGFRGFFSVNLSHLRNLQIWWLLSFLQGAHSPQLSFFWHPVHSPQRLRFFFVGLSGSSTPIEGVGCWMPPWTPNPTWGLKASARPARVSGVGSVEEIAATWPGVSTEDWSLSLPSSDPALAVFFLNWAAKGPFIYYVSKKGGWGRPENTQ